MESETDGLLYIPNRRIEFTNERPASLRQCWYLLTDEEAELLRQDDRVFCVEIPPEFRTDIVMMPRITQTGDFTKTTSDSGAFLNWGLIRSSNSTNVYGTGTTIGLNYTYTLDGTGVDVVTQDSGLQIDHPEFQDASGNSRVQQIDWGSYSGGAFTQNANHYRDLDGHGTHCAGIATGKTYGWAKNARVYSQKLSGLEGTGDSGTGISITYAFDAIKTWHTSKAGARPTVVNMSWGYGTYYNTVTSLTYRGTSYTDVSTTGNASYRYSTYGLNSSSGGLGGTYIANVRIGSVDTDIEELITAGVIVCIAAGNRGTKIENYKNFLLERHIEFDIFGEGYDRFNDHEQICEYKGYIHLPYQTNIQSLWENLGYYIIYFIPSKKFITELIMNTQWYYWEEKYRHYDLLMKSIELSEWYSNDNEELFEFFDSWDHLKYNINNITDEYLINKKNKIQNFIKKNNETNLNKWVKMLYDLV
jgi:hypothetical protein